MIVIAEVKTQSPFGYRSENSWDELFEIAQEVGDWISVHTDPRWGGSFDLLTKATGKRPVLAKGIHESDDDIRRALDMGADYVLVVGRIPPDTFLNKCLLEPRSYRELESIPHDVKAVWNSRDLDTGLKKDWKTAGDFDIARQGWSGWLCQASFINSNVDVNPGADAILVGQGLINIAKYMRARGLVNVSSD